MGGWRSSDSFGPDGGAGRASRNRTQPVTNSWPGRFAAPDTAHAFHHNPRHETLDGGVVLASSAAEGRRLIRRQESR